MTLIITICFLLLLAYLFDISSGKTKIPSVILLLIAGWIVKQIAQAIEIPIPDLTPILPIIGTVGLILIVMEGTLELELNKSKIAVVLKALVISLIPMLIFNVVLALAFQKLAGVSFKTGFINAIPLSVISSAIAIPSAQRLLTRNREFVTYESSLSDIFGVILFNFLVINQHIKTVTVGFFTLELFLVLIIAIIATLGLTFLLGKIKHHVKFIPIILMVVMIYGILKIYHMPALIFILLFGIFLGNIDEFKTSRFIQRFKPETLIKEVDKLKELTAEFAFLIRALFFLLFGYLIQLNELLNSETFIWALAITTGIFLIRYVFIKLFRLDVSPLMYIAPRGLITILLFLTIPANLSIYIVNKSLILQVIILTTLVMMFGLMTNRKKEESKAEELISETENPD